MNHRTLLLSSAAILLSLLVFPLSGSPAERASIYVRDLVAGRGVGQQEAERVSRQLERAAIQSGRYNVMSQSQVRELMMNAEFQQALGCNSESCLKQIMKTTQTEYMMYGEVTKEDGEYSVSVNLMHRQRGGNAEVTGTATQFTTAFTTKTLTLLSKVLIKQLHGERVSDDEHREMIGNTDAGGLVLFTVTSIPNNAVLYINGARKGATPKRIRYPEGNFSAVLKHPGYRDKSFSVSLPSQRTYTVRMDREQYTLRLSPGRGMPAGIIVYDRDEKIATLGNGELAVRIDSGEHLLVFEREGYEDKNVALNINGNTSYRVTMRKGSYPLTVKTNADPAEVYLNGRKAGRTPYTGTHPYGEYTVKVAREDFLEIEKKVTLTKRTILEYQMQKQVFVPFRVESTPPGAKIFFGGKYQGITPKAFQWPEGELEITVKRALVEKSIKPVLRKGRGIQTFSFNVNMKDGRQVSMFERDEALRSRYRPGEEKTIGDMDFVFVPGGYFMMGSPNGEGHKDEHPRHKVYVSPFWMGKYEVTRKQYDTAMKRYRGTFREWLDRNDPSVWRFWVEAVDYCKKFSLKHGVKARLPYEAEWECAARAGTSTRYYWGENVDGDYCWNADNSGRDVRTVHPVGRKRPNAWGLYDMSGNVYEWCMDRYNEYYYRRSPKINPRGPASGNKRVIRGGAYGYVVGNPNYLRSADRDCCDLNYTERFYGFRVVVVPAD